MILLRPSRDLAPRVRHTTQQVLLRAAPHGCAPHPAPTTQEQERVKQQERKKQGAPQLHLKAVSVDTNCGAPSLRRQAAGGRRAAAQRQSPAVCGCSAVTTAGVRCRTSTLRSLPPMERCCCTRPSGTSTLSCGPRSVPRHAATSCSLLWKG